MTSELVHLRCELSQQKVMLKDSIATSKNARERYVARFFIFFSFFLFIFSPLNHFKHVIQKKKKIAYNILENIMKTD